MSAAYVNQAENSSAAGVATLAALTTLTLGVGDTVEVWVYGQIASSATITVLDGLGNVYSLQSTSPPVGGGPAYLFVYTASVTIPGTATVSMITSQGVCFGIYAKQISGVGAVIGSISNVQNGPGSGANVTVSGTVALSGTQNIFVSGLSANTQFGTPVASPGTAPITFTGRTAVWSTWAGGTAFTVPEDARVVGASGTAQATFGNTGGGAQFDTTITGVVVYAEAGAASPVQLYDPLVGIRTRRSMPQVLMMNDFGNDDLVVMTGVMAGVNSPDIFNGLGFLTLVGVLATLNSPDIFAGTGSQPGVAGGVMAVTNAPDFFSGTGNVPGVISGILSGINSPDIFSGSGTALPPTPVTADSGIEIVYVHGSLQYFPRKLLRERTVLSFNFSPGLFNGNLLTTGLSVNISTFVGADPSPQTLLGGTPTYDSTMTKILVPIQGGVTGAQYLVEVESQTGDTNILLGMQGIVTIASNVS